MRVIFLDIDGVLNRAGFQPEGDLRLRAWIEPDLAQRLSGVVQTTGASLVLSSDWRLDHELSLLQDELAAAGVVGPLIGTTPALHDLLKRDEVDVRWREIHAWMTEHAIGVEAAVIVDDMRDMGPLRRRFVRTSSEDGLDDAAAQAIVALFENR